MKTTQDIISDQLRHARGIVKDDDYSEPEVRKRTVKLEDLFGHIKKKDCGVHVKKVKKEKVAEQPTPSPPKNKSTIRMSGFFSHHQNDLDLKKELKAVGDQQCIDLDFLV